MKEQKNIHCELAVCLLMSTICLNCSTKKETTFKDAVSFFSFLYKFGIPTVTQAKGRDNVLVQKTIRLEQKPDLKRGICCLDLLFFIIFPNMKQKFIIS